MNSILVHFDVEEHYVLLDTFIASAVSTRRAVEAFNQTYFDGKLVFEVVIYPPETGSLKQYVGIFLKGVKKLGKGAAITAGTLWALVQVLDSETVQDMSVEFLGDKPSEILIEQIKGYQEKFHDVSEENLETLDQEKVGDLEKEAFLLLEEVVSRSVTSALEMPRSDLERIDVPAQLKFELSEAQAALYGQALNDPKIRAIGFSEDNDFPIPRSNFAERAIRPRQIDVDAENEIEWKVTQRRIRVSSPNFDRDDQSARKWKGKDTSGQQLLFEIVDEEFWLKLSLSEFEFSETTELYVQMAAKFEAGRQKENKVIRVLAIDGRSVAEPLSEDALQSILGMFEVEKNSNSDPGLFEC